MKEYTKEEREANRQAFFKKTKLPDGVLQPCKPEDCCPDGTCTSDHSCCGERDCFYGDFLHYHLDGCPSCLYYEGKEPWKENG